MKVHGLILATIIAVLVKNVTSQNATILCDGSKFVAPYPYGDCSEFVVCSSGILGTCPSDKPIFDSTKQVCAQYGTCYVPDYVQTQCQFLAVGTFLPHALCDHFYICMANTVKIATCPAGKHFSRAYNGCVNMLNAGCKLLGEMCEGQDDGFTFPGLTCSNYYVCNTAQVPVEQTCSSKTNYDPSIGECSSTYVCSDDIIIPGSTSGTDPTEGTTSTTTTTTTTPKTTTVKTTTEAVTTTSVATTTANPNTYCEKQANGYKVANPNDCTKYYMCYEGRAISLVCFTDQYFSQGQQYCSVDFKSSCPASSL